MAAYLGGELLGHFRRAAQALQVGEVVVAHLFGIFEAIDAVVGTRQVELAARDALLDGRLEGLYGLFGFARLQAAHAIPEAVVAVGGLRLVVAFHHRFGLGIFALVVPRSGLGQRLCLDGGGTCHQGQAQQAYLFLYHLHT